MTGDQSFYEALSMEKKVIYDELYHKQLLHRQV
jgi:hypothetical protein